MNTNDISVQFEEMAEMAEKLETEAKDMDGKEVASYTPYFKTPVTIGDKEYISPTFDWSLLTGDDSLAIEADLLAIGITLIVPAFTEQ